MSEKLTCRQAVDFISKKEEGKLSAGQRFKLWRHLGECSLCRIFSMQNKIMKTAMAHQKAGMLTVSEKEAIIKKVVETTT